MRLFANVCISLLSVILAHGETNVLIRRAADLSSLVDAGKGIGSSFELRGKIVAPVTSNSKFVHVEDESGGATLNFGLNDGRSSFRPGDIVTLTGRIDTNTTGQVFADLFPNITFERSEAPIHPIKVSADDLRNDKFILRLIRISGIIRDIFPDEVDPPYAYVVINCDGQIIYSVIRLENPKTAGFKIGARVTLDGFLHHPSLGARQHIGRMFAIHNVVEVTDVTEDDIFESPLLQKFTNLTPPEIAMLGRHSVFGRVLASWQGGNILLKTAQGEILKAELAGNTCPTNGETIHAVGFPESDLYHLNLTRTIWRHADICGIVNDIPIETTAESLQTSKNGHVCFDSRAHGRTIRLTGIVRTLPAEGNNDGRFNIECGHFIVPIDVSRIPEAIKGLSVGCTIIVCGTCVMESDNWRPNAAFPQIRSFFVVVRDPSDIRIVQRPSWWTPRRLLSVIGILIIVLMSVLAWNVVLRRVAVRKGCELMREQLGHVKAELKTEERTRLAVELHDSLAQNLTGVSLEIDTAAKMADEDPSSMKTHLGIAAQSLKSCRDELRNCLWDLRNRALETRTMDEAIRQTLAPHVAGVAVAIRFNVPRERISDNTAHAILRIIRELTLNGIRHGGATKVWIAGSIENGRMHFSVRDNGCGFDPGSAPGFGEGHYGLLGIQERIDEFEGEFTLKSSPGKGTRATVSINVPQET